MRLAVAQLNHRVADFDYNFSAILRAVKKAKRARAQAVLFPEMVTTGYPVDDLLYHAEFVEANAALLKSLAPLSADIAIVMGTIFQSKQVRVGPCLEQGAALFRSGEMVLFQPKRYLPNSDVFNDARYFSPALRKRPVLFPLTKTYCGAVSICEDMWNIPETSSLYSGSRPYAGDYMGELAHLNPDIMINLSASPFWRGKVGARLARAREIAQTHRVPFLYVNCVGAQDELIYDGRSFALNADGECVWRMPAYEEAVDVLDTALLTKKNRALKATHALKSVHLRDQTYVEAADGQASILRALELGLSDYMKKSGFDRVLLGLSGGIDSALTAAIAVRALGRERVLALWLPSPFSSKMSEEEAKRTARILGIELRTIPIASLMNESHALTKPFRRKEESWNLADENTQARLRGLLLMTLSNAEGRLLLTTGNKSEIAMGYCTLYGDMCGGLNLIGDLYKTEVYALSRYVNTLKTTRDVFSERLLVRPPTAELRPNQTDQDSLPPYDVLDAILSAYIEGGQSIQSIVETITARGVDVGFVQTIVSRMHAQDYKRKQSAPILKVSRRAFGVGWRYPITKNSAFA